MSSQTVIVKLLDKDYQVACPEGQQTALLRAADHLDQQMRDIKSNGKVIGLERIAVMAALNIANELLQQAEIGGAPVGTAAQEATQPSDNSELKDLNDKLDEALQRYRQLEIG